MSAIVFQRSTRRARRVPFVQQLEASDCGASCLAMVLAFHGRHVAVESVKRAVGTLRGANALSLLDAATGFGLSGRGIHLELSELHSLPCGAILHWGFHHFVVFERYRAGAIDIVDPAFGRRRVPLERFSREFTGVALVFEPVESFVRAPPKRAKTWRPLARLFAQPNLVVRVLIASIVIRVALLALPIVTGVVIDHIVPLRERGLIVYVGIASIGTLLFYFLGSLLRSHLLIELRARMDVQMMTGFVAHMMSLPMSYFLRISAGDLMMRVHSNIQIRELLTSSLLSALFDSCVALTYLVLLAAVAPLFAVVCVVLAATQAIIIVSARTQYRSLTALDLETQARSQSWLSQMLAGVGTLKASGAEQRAVAHWSNLHMDNLNVALARSKLTALLEACAGVFRVGAPLLLIWVGTTLVLDGSLTLGTMMATSAIAIGFLAPVGTVTQDVLQLQMFGSYVERIEDVVTMSPEQSSGVPCSPPRLTGAVELKNVSFRYDENGPLVLSNINLTIEAGSTVAIVGRSGSGKSTLAALMIGLHVPTEGDVRYDGHSLAGLELRRLRQQMGMVLQQAYLFSGTIRSNIALANPSLSAERMTWAAKVACIHDDIIAMPMAYETSIAEGGGSLSGGQCQRIAIARAIANRPAVLLLDEATSSLDTETERLVTANMKDLHVTKIVIAHRLSTIVGASKIVVLDCGRVAEVGTHHELMRSGGPYAALIAEQARVGDAPIA